MNEETYINIDDTFALVNVLIKVLKETKTNESIPLDIRLSSVEALASLMKLQVSILTTQLNSKIS
jgi:hypothetical protein